MKDGNAGTQHPVVDKIRYSVPFRTSWRSWLEDQSARFCLRVGTNTHLLKIESGVKQKR
jgi:hypothetical protein